MNRPDRIEPGPGQESVWDYPRPPRVEDMDEHVQVLFAGAVLADTRRAKRCLETSHPPTVYIPRGDIRTEWLQEAGFGSVCEFKGKAFYWSVVVEGQTAERAIWEYPTPDHDYHMLKDHLCFYPSKMEACFIGSERVQPQEGDFYGGWITSRVVGPFKGSAGTRGW